MSYSYAQLNKDNICIGVSTLSGKVDFPHMIPIDNSDGDYIWRKYEKGQWSEEKFKPDIEGVEAPEESVEDKLARLEEQNLILMDAIATMFEEILILRGEE
ncbi:hypothetical protein [Desulfofalx alkaliphila]|uniref:hypothetical protein n=1 Tax=Desulfofalx alkaliphila TaxID=105483 RepID=UPI0004E0D72C|nr:hypothetical protein [Desulfofalx alkaliphila]